MILRRVLYPLISLALLLTGASALTSCGGPRIQRRATAAELTRLAELEALIAASARLSRNPMAEEVLEELRSARQDGRVRVFSDPGTVHGRVVGDIVFVHEQVFRKWDRSPTFAVTALGVYYHEGVHASQSWWALSIDVESAEAEAYRETHQFLAELLAQQLAGAAVPDLWREAVPPAERLQRFVAGQAGFVQTGLGARWSQARLAAARDAALAEPGRLCCVYPGQPTWLEDVPFVAAGDGWISAEIALAALRPEEMWRSSRVPGRARRDRWSMAHTPALARLGPLLPGVSDAGRLAAVTPAWLVASPMGGGANHAPDWNEADVGAEIVGGATDDRVRLRVRARGAAGRWRLGLLPQYTFELDRSRVAAFRAAGGEERAPEQLGRLQGWLLRRLDGQAPFQPPHAGPLKGPLRVVYDRRVRQVDLLPIGLPWEGLALCAVALDGARTLDGRTPGTGWPLPGWRPASATTPRLIEVHPLWHPDDVRSRHTRSRGFIATGPERGWLLLAAADFRTGRPRLRAAGVWSR